jgi:hypothetical protein
VSIHELINQSINQSIVVPTLITGETIWLCRFFPCKSGPIHAPSMPPTGVRKTIRNHSRNLSVCIDSRTVMHSATVQRQGGTQSPPKEEVVFLFKIVSKMIVSVGAW